MKRNNIELDIHHFARAQNNSDGHILEWLETNIKESEIHRLNRNDYSNGPTNLRTRYMSEERMDKYYPLNMKVDKGLNDVIYENNEDIRSSFGSIDARILRHFNNGDNCAFHNGRDRH